jgi:hemolysin activation/secretion protein
VRDIELGFDAKSSNNNLEFGGTEVYDTTTEIYQFTAGYDMTLSDRLGVTRIDLNTYFSPGGWTGQNTDETFEQARFGASADYIYGNVGVERQQRLPREWSLRARGQGQLSSGNLLASEQLGTGGYDTVRGFEQRIIRGDQGMWGSLELYTPPVSIARIADWKNETDELRFLAFVDAAVLGNVDPIVDEPGKLEMASVGVGLRWRYSDWFRLRLDYGHPVGTNNLGGIVEENGRLHIGATANF